MSSIHYRTTITIRRCCFHMKSSVICLYQINIRFRLFYYGLTMSSGKSWIHRSNSEDRCGSSERNIYGLETEKREVSVQRAHNSRNATCEPMLCETLVLTCICQVLVYLSIICLMSFAQHIWFFSSFLELQGWLWG